LSPFLLPRDGPIYNHNTPAVYHCRARQAGAFL